jgi:hypothetical protein
VDADALAAHLAGFEALDRERTALARRAFYCLQAAAPLRRDAAQVHAAALDLDRLDALLTPFAEAIDAFHAPTDGNAQGRERRLFAEALTAGGLDRTWQGWAYPRQWRVDAPWAADVHEALSILRDTALGHGLDVCSMMDPFTPGRIAHLVIPDLGLSITSYENEPAERVLDLREAQAKGAWLTQSTQRALAFDRANFEHLTAQAVDCLAQARQLQRHMDRAADACLDQARIRAAAESVLCQTFQI